MRVEIVSHCWHYSRLLIFQLSSLFLFPPKDVLVTITVFHTEGDPNTLEVLNFFRGHRSPPTVALRSWSLAPNIVTRCMIGRNLAALATECDWIWFTDCDYVFREGCLDSMKTWSAGPDQQLFFPREVRISRSHEEGDQELRRIGMDLYMLDIQPDLYVQKWHRKAIGGIQVVPGELARRIGYCRSSRYHSMRSPTWVSTREDHWFRKSLGTPGLPMDVCNLYRIRHSTREGLLLDGAQFREGGAA